MARKRVVSGIRPTGDLHLGNYFGAIRDFVELQADAELEVFFFVADLHALTTAAADRSDIDALSIEVLRLYLACGLDPEKSVIYRQSDIPEIPYLALLLGMIAPEGELRRCTTYKEQKALLERSGAKEGTPVSLGLLAYPVLMGADVLFCNADLVPVGEDQLQHLEIIRETARRYNSHIGRSHKFSEPMPYRPSSLRVPGLKGEGKMSKSAGSEDNAVDLLDSPKEIRRKVMAAVTDSGPAPAGEMSEPVRNLFTLCELCCPPEAAQRYRKMHEAGEQRFYGEMKKELAQGIEALLMPIQDRWESPECSAERVRQMLYENAERVRTLARGTLTAVQADFGLRDLS